METNLLSCVFSAGGVIKLRNYLNHLYLMRSSSSNDLQMLQIMNLEDSETPMNFEGEELADPED